MTARPYRFVAALLGLALALLTGCSREEEESAADAEASAVESASAPAAAANTIAASQLIAATREYAEAGCSVARRRLERCAECEAPAPRATRDLLLAYCAERESSASARELYEEIITHYPSSEVSATAIMRVRQIDAAELPLLTEFAGPKPVAIDRPQPAYPTLAEVASIEGRVRLRFDVRDDGSVGNVRVVESSPPLIFDAVALYAVSSWEYEPGAAAESQQVLLRFDLPDAAAAPEIAK